MIWWRFFQLEWAILRTNFRVKIDSSNRLWPYWVTSKWIQFQLNPKQHYINLNWILLLLCSQWTSNRQNCKWLCECVMSLIKVLEASKLLHTLRLQDLIHWDRQLLLHHISLQTRPLVMVSPNSCSNTHQQIRLMIFKWLTYLNKFRVYLLCKQ